MNRAKAFAPVNIAWIKYMGKRSGFPTNSSLSLTLATLGTHTEMEVTDQGSVLQFHWNSDGYVPPLNGQTKMEAFLLDERIWKPLLQEFGFEMIFPKNEVRILTRNNVPAGTGIATSASAFAAVTLAWSAILCGSRKKEWIGLYETGNPAFRIALANASMKGSGSSCRSFDGPWVEWNPSRGISVIDGGVRDWMDFIFVFESGPKDVSSSDAHLRVLSSPKFQGRETRAEKRLQELKALLQSKTAAVRPIRDLVLDEAMDMHDLFASSLPPFRYMTSQSEELVSWFRHADSRLPSESGVITLDAGANVHLFVPIGEKELWNDWIQKRFPHVKVIQDLTGYGAVYED